MVAAIKRHEAICALAGKGAIIGKELSREIRSHKDLEKDSCEFWRPAVQFFEAISTTLVAHSHALDVFACALEQSGLAEMKPAIQATGGLVVQTDTFRNPMFKDSLTRVFANSSDEGFSGRCSCATLDVYTSRDIKLQARA
jgi:protein transport protein SEC23